jgi:hypothetical protein
MTDSKFKKLFVEELDETMFHSLDFHAELKESVRSKAIDESRGGRLVFFKRLLQHRHLGKLSAVAVIFTLFISALLLFDQETKVPEKSNLKTLQNNNLIDGQNYKNVREINSLEEARTSFGNSVMLPSYNPDYFTLERIHLLGVGGETDNKLILTYTSGEKVYSVIIEKDIHQMKPLGLETVDINGAEGYLKKEESVEILDAELQWYRDGIHYMVSGLIPSSEAVKIAQSFK